MYWKDIVELVRVESESDGAGYAVNTYFPRRVYADVQFVKRNEFYAARQDGTDIAVSILIRGADYDGERLVDHNGKRYCIVRAWSKDGEIVELNCSLESTPVSAGKG